MLSLKTSQTCDIYIRFMWCRYDRKSNHFQSILLGTITSSKPLPCQQKLKKTTVLQFLSVAVIISKSFSLKARRETKRAGAKLAREKV